ncbi:MAG TPA: CDP-alcohol phosphatidyltransferase family protein [Actinopolymorphaceae bacterium]
MQITPPMPSGRPSTPSVPSVLAVLAVLSGVGAGKCVRRELPLWAAAQLLLLAALSTVGDLGPAAWVAGAGYILTLLVVLGAALRRSGAASVGPANRVTLARSVLVGGVTALTVEALTGGRLPHALLVTLTVVALVLDAVDGRVARRTNTASPLGARFDVEIDAFLVLVLSALVASTLGVWVLTIGLMRYGYVAASWSARWLRIAVLPSLARKLVGALQGVALVVAAADVLPHPAARLGLGVALALLCWSFRRDIGWQWRHREPRRRERGTGDGTT